MLALVLAVTAMFGAVWAPAAVSAAVTKRALPVYSVEREGKYCALTFDAAWGNEDTEQLIEILQRYGVKATFFLVGSWVDKYPESVRALQEAGMELGNHSDTHPHIASLSSEKIMQEVSACSDKIEQITGVRPALFRCPYGEYDDHVIGTVSGMGITSVQWDVDSLDWKDYDAATITQRITSRVQPGSIILCHNAALHTPEALPAVLDYLLAEGYTPVTVSELLLHGDCSIDNNGRQHLLDGES